MINTKIAYKKFEERYRQELEFLDTEEGQEILLCLVAQGYEDIVFGRYIILFGSGFTAMEIIKDIREMLK